MKTLALWIFEILFFTITGANGLRDFPTNFVVVKMSDDHVVLTCNTSTDASVTWKFNDESVDMTFDSDVFQQVGQNLNVLDTFGTFGKYSCWNGATRISSTHLLQEVEATQETDSHLKCWAKSYDCNFTCTWTDSELTVVRLGVGPNCTEGGQSCQWVCSNNKLGDGGFQFELSHSLSPYAEETTMLIVHVEAMSNVSFLRTKKTFYLRDIIEPDSPQIVMCQEEEGGLSVTIDPPSSWSTPSSYFRLEHEIEFVHRDNGKSESSSSNLIPKRISKLRARTRDALVLSHWSQWTPWKNVKTGVKCKCRNTDKYCCPELPPGYLDKCKKKRKNKKNRDIKGN